MMNTVVLLACLTGTNLALPLLGLTASNSLEILGFGGLGLGMAQSQVLPFGQQLVSQLSQIGSPRQVWLPSQGALPAQQPQNPQMLFPAQGPVNPSLLLPAQGPINPNLLFPAQGSGQPMIFFQSQMPPSVFYPQGNLPSQVVLSPPVILSSQTNPGQMPRDQGPQAPIQPQAPVDPQGPPNTQQPHVHNQFLPFNPIFQQQAQQDYPYYYYQYLQQQNQPPNPTQTPDLGTAESAATHALPEPLQKTPLEQTEVADVISLMEP
ncbi:synapsin-1-like [Amia ocellicauda]|uniref:synapsin-1-like n=1 Tax=Amia ocellicauda TaxID=2972642 RepID=UPI003463F8C8